MSERSAVDLAATVRIGLTWTPQKHQAAPIAALDALVARCKQAERERDRLAVEFDKWDVRLCASEARVAELEAALRNIDVGFALSAHEMRDIARAVLAAAPADTEKCDHWCSHTYNDGGNLCCGRCGAVSEVPVFNSQTNSSLTADTEGSGRG